MSDLSEMPNDKVVVLAAYVAGAGEMLTDTEDIAIKANEIAPGRFNWRKYREQINIEAVRKRLYDAAKPEKGGLVAGSERGGWLLTSEGIKFAEKNACKLKGKADFKPRLSSKERSWQNREKARMLGEPAFEKWSSGKTSEISLMEAEAFFGIDDYVQGEARKTKVERAGRIFRGDADLEKAIAALAELLGGKNG